MQNRKQVSEQRVIGKIYEAPFNDIIPNKMTGVRSGADGGHATIKGYWGALYLQITGPGQNVYTYL